MTRLRYLLLMLLVFLGKAFCQPSYVMSLSNGEFVDSKTLEFDVEVKSSAVDFSLTSYQCVLTFNDSLINGGNLTFEYIASSSEISNYPSNGIGAQFLDGYHKLHFASNPGSDNIDSVGTRVGRFRLKNTSDFPEVRPNFNWCFSGTVNTILTGSNFANITDSLNFVSLIFQEPTPVELVSFYAEIVNNKIELRWNTATETNNLGFSIQRRSETDDYKEIAFINGNGTSTEILNYFYQDNAPIMEGKSFYRLKQIDLDGSESFSNEIEVSLIPNEFNLSQNYPNPFNPSTNFNYTLPYNANVNISVYSITGEKIETLFSGIKSSGTYEVTWNAMGLASGIYILNLELSSEDGVKHFSQVKKMILQK